LFQWRDDLYRLLGVVPTPPADAEPLEILVE
jgi:hypothetical protein